MSSFRTRLSGAARALTSSSLSVGLLLALALTPGCGSPSPAPAYPTPEDPALEDTEFTGVLGMDGAEDEGEPAEDDWEDPSAGAAETAEKPSRTAR